MPVFHQYQSGTVKLVRMSGSTATVAVKEAIQYNFLIPGFFPISTRYDDRQLQLVREGNAWKISWHP